MMYLKLLLIILGLSFIVSEECTSFKSCKTCISSTLHCIWCTDKRMPDDNRPRCESRDKLYDESWCSDADNPETEKPKVPEYNEKGQLQPPLVNINARPGDTVSFSMVYKPEKDYPVDIYYLFDNSDTMKDYTSELVDEASNIHKELGKVSNNVQFGVGSFVEKLKEPFSSEKHNHPTFNNHLSLTNDTDIFVEAVKAVKIGANFDNPEAGLDALMQILACDTEIKWRLSARRIVILSTDDTYHSAGDGIAVGAYVPNDMKCHLINTSSNSTSHMYSKEASLLFDYPSVGQISHMAKTKAISIFFTATKNVEAEYRALADAVEGSKYIELKVKKEGKNSTLVETIKTEYVKLSQNLQIPRPKVPPHLELKLSPDCEKKEDDDCNIPHNGEIKINVSLTVKSCPSGNDNTHKLIISPNGMKDTVNIIVHVLCQCKCATKSDENSSVCRPDNATASRGAFQCGECKCYGNWYGKTCSCEGNSTEEEDLRKCKISENHKEPCSGKGTCRCGECILCWNGYGGPQCQYRTDKCPVFEDKVCAGHGECKEEKCKCKPGWKGDSCSCPTSTDMCVGGNTEVCSGRGVCECGVCACTDSNKYSGLYCDQCDDTCVEERCQQLNDYVICIYDGEKKTDKQTCDKKTKLKSNIIEVEVKNQTEINAWSDANYCEKVIDDGSIIVYKYYDGNNFTKIWIQSEKKLPPKTNIWIPIGGAVGGILLIGILTLIAWKILVDTMDAREYRKFAENAERDGYEVMDNPLYKPAAVSINNPAYTNQ